MHSNNTVTPWEKIKYSSKSLKDKLENTIHKAISTAKAKVEDKKKDLPEYLASLETNVNKVVSGVRTQAESLSKFLEDKVQDTGKSPINVETKRKYKIEDLPKFFKQRSKKIGQIFSDEVVEISTIRSRSIALPIIV